MGRKVRVVSNKHTAAPKRTRRGSRSDEEFVVGEEEGEESFDEYLSADASEGEFEFGDSSCDSEEEPEIYCNDQEEADNGEVPAIEEEEGEKEKEKEEVTSRGLMTFNTRTRRSRVPVFDDAEEEKQEDRARSRRRNVVVMDYADEEGEDDVADEDFQPDDEEDNDNEDAALDRGDVKRGEKRRRSKACGRKLQKKLPGAGSDDEDADFVVEIEQLDSDFYISDDDFVAENPIAPRKPGNKVKNVGRRRKRMLVVSDSSSDSDRMLPKEEMKNLGIGVIDPVKITRHLAEKGKEKEEDELGKQFCGICLSEEQKRTVQGKLDCCAHFFCFACIMEWSRVETRCPVCKRRFSTITKTSKSDPGHGMKKIVAVQIRDQIYQPLEEDIRQMLDPYGNVVCTECQRGDDESLMLLCDICDSCAHTYCVGLGRVVPEGNWYCDCCRSATNGSSHLPNQVTPTNEGVQDRENVSAGTETGDALNHVSPFTQQSESLPRLIAAQRFDLNAPPTLEDDYGVLYQVSGGGALTVSGRRAIHQHICTMLSNGRPGQMF